MSKECKHKSRAYSPYGIQTNNSSTSYWICKDCGFEGYENNPVANEYEKTKMKFKK